MLYHYPALMGLRIGPVRFNRRGVRVSFGPRIARIHVGAGQTRISSGVGPFTASTTAGGKRGRRRVPPMSSIPKPPPANLPTVKSTRKDRVLVGMMVAGLLVTIAICGGIEYLTKR